MCACVCANSAFVGQALHEPFSYSLVPRPHPLRGKRGLVNLDRFLGLAGSVRARRNCCTETNLGSDWSVMLLGRGPTIQIYIAGNGALHSCDWRVT